MAKILVVDNEENIAQLIKFNLEKESYEVIVAYDGSSALNKINFEKPDLVVLDVMLPGMDGFELCRMLRADKSTVNIPIIMLTAKADELDKILGLELGADDYMTKPFSPRELVTRIKVRLRRGGVIEDFTTEILQEEIKTGHIIMRPGKFEVEVNGDKIDFTLKEFELLKLLITNPGKVFTRDYLLDRIWGFDYSHDTRTVDVHIRHLRQKVESDPAKPQSIMTIRGIGYKFQN